MTSSYLHETNTVWYFQKKNGFNLRATPKFFTNLSTWIYWERIHVKPYFYQ